MKINYGFLLVAAMVAVSGSASAEEYSGRVHSVNSVDGSVQILRNDTNDYISVYATDRNQLNSLRNGSEVTFDATQRNSRWETSSFRAGAASSVSRDSRDNRNNRDNTYNSSSSASGSLSTSTNASLGASGSSSSNTSGSSAGVGVSTGVSANTNVL